MNMQSVIDYMPWIKTAHKFCTKDIRERMLERKYKYVNINNACKHMWPYFCKSVGVCHKSIGLLSPLVVE